MRPPTVSVIIPHHNDARTLRLCPESVAAHTYPHIETVLVDDGSTDEFPGSPRSTRSDRCAPPTAG